MKMYVHINLPLASYIKWPCINSC